MRPRLAFLLPVLAALAIIPFSACQNEGEGKPCDTQAGNGGNDDCQPPLICTTGLTNTGANSARCCPQNRATATTPECAQATSVVNGDASSAPPDSSTAETSSPEAAQPEAAGDAPPESAAEAGLETGAGDDASDGASSDGVGSEAAADAAGE